LEKQIRLKFDRRFKNDDYELLFNTSTGLELLQGVNGKEDPFSLCLPSLLDIGIMGSCKNKCLFCYQGHDYQPNMKLSDFMSIIDDVHHHTNQVALGGRGDPNKHPHFADMLEYCRKHNVVPNYTTSGIDLTDDEIEASTMCGAVAVSDYEKDFTYDALQRFMDAGIKTNIHQIFDAETFFKCISLLAGNDYWKGRVDIDQLNAVIFLLFKPQGSGKGMKSLQPSEIQLETIADTILKPECDFKVGMDSCLANHVLRYVTPSALQAMSIDTCEAARMSGYITPDMKFKPCSFAECSTEVHLGWDEISAIWNTSDSFNFFRDKLRKKSNSCPIGF
jgi:MoaA/NifB/PqqE/SkfB family radical SAM enzyme